MFDRVPFRAGEVTYVAPPFFHALGFATLVLALSLGGEVVTRRRFEPEGFLDALASRRVRVAVVVPAMLQRTLELGDDVVRSHDTSALRIIFCSGSQLPGPTATRTLELFGDVLHVLYGSTEVAFASISVPADHRAAPATVGQGDPRDHRPAARRRGVVRCRRESPDGSSSPTGSSSAATPTAATRR